jgi:hypothetical protein
MWATVLLSGLVNIEALLALDQVSCRIGSCELNLPAFA